MKTYLVKYESQGNLAEGSMVVSAANLVEAQDKFLSWLKHQPLYQHMWRLSFEFVEIQGVLEQCSYQNTQQ